MRLPNTHLVLAFALPPSLVVLAAATACDPLASERCNTDDDCGRFTCILGQCVDRDRETVLDGDSDDDDDDDDDDDGDDGTAGNPGENGVVACDDQPGSVTAFNDVDGDGHGAGPAFCALSFGPGVVERGDDCNDEDPSTFSLQTVFIDVDNDGFTSGSTSACVGEELFPGTFTSPQGAPVRLVGVDDVITNDGLFDEDTFVMESSPFGEDTASFTLTGIECAAALDVVTNLEVRLDIFRELNTDASFEVSVFIEANDQFIAEELASASFGAGDVDENGALSVVFGGAEGNVGAGLDPELACSGDLEITFNITVFDNEERSAFAFDIEARAFGAEDCNDLDSETFSPANLRLDDDADGFGEGDLVEHCIGDDIPFGLARNSGDCAPNDERAFPGQDTRFSSQRVGVGGFDYNCDGVEEKRFNTVQDVSSCTLEGSTCHFTFFNRTPSCGSTITIGDCFSGCTFGYTSFTQTCR